MMLRIFLLLLSALLGGCSIQPNANLLDVARGPVFPKAGTYEFWVTYVGKAKTDQIIAGIGLANLNVIADNAGYLTMIQFIDALNDGAKFIELFNQATSTSRLSGLLAAFADRRNSVTPAALSSFLNTLPLSEITKFAGFLRMLSDSIQTTAGILPSPDHVLLAQLMADYSGSALATNSGVGTGFMNAVFGNLDLTNGQNYTTAPTITGGALNATGGTGALATALTSVGLVTRVTVTGAGTNCTSISGVSLSGGGGGSGATLGMTVVPEAGNDTNVKLDSLYITNPGSGYTIAPTVSFNATGCSVAPTANTSINGLAGWTVTAPGAGYTNSFALTAGNITGGGGSGASGTVLVAGAINTGGTGLTSFNGGTGYVTGQVCPVFGAGGTGASCTVTASSGSLTGCSAMTGGAGYIGGQIVSIGGAATAHANFSLGGNISSLTIDNPGCGYVTSPAVTLLTGSGECATGGSYAANLTAGRVTSITVISPATGCPANPTVVIGETPYATHGDNASAVVNALTNGSVIGISMSGSVENFAQLITNQEKSPGSKVVTYTGASPSISAREAFVRLFLHGVNYTSSGFISFFGTDNVNFPGIGPKYLAKNVVTNTSGAGTVNSIINLLNTDGTNLSDTAVLMGCADRIEYAVPNAFAVMTVNDFYQFCFNHSPSLW